jgi:hypothetical protein
MPPGQWEWQWEWLWVGLALSTCQDSGARLPSGRTNKQIAPGPIAAGSVMPKRGSLPRRIVVRGDSGAGKTTFAAAVAGHLGVSHIELDALNHGPLWTQASAPELRAKVEDAISTSDGWVVDGNYDSRLGRLLLDRADLILWLDLRLAVKLSRVFRRSVRRIRRAEELWSGNRETWRGAFWGRESLFMWTIRSHFRHRPVLRLRSRAEVAGFLASPDPCQTS